MPAEWTTYRYDMAGNMVRAENADAIVERTYHPNGQLRTDTTRIRDFEAGNVFAKVYGIAYGYDPHGRMNRLFHPGNLANLNGIADADSFSYHPQTGALARARDRNGNHAAIMVTRDNGTQILIELLNGQEGEDKGKNVISYRVNPEASDLARYEWTPLDTPDGQTDAEFSMNILRNANIQAIAHWGRDYLLFGQTNSNHFVWATVVSSGGLIPYRADRRTGFTPGLCGGGLWPWSRGHACTSN